MTSRNRGFVHLVACTAICVALVLCAPFAAAQSSWQAEWEKTLRATEAEGQFALYGCCDDYDRVLEVFRKRYPKIKPNVIVAVAGNSLASRILAERRAEKYLVDVVSSGANMLHDAFTRRRFSNRSNPRSYFPKSSINQNGMRAAAAVPPAARSASRRARPIPMQRKF